MDKRKTLIASIAVIAVMIIAGIVYAATSINSAKNYAINVVNDGSNMEATDSNVKVQTIVTSDDDTEITMQTSVENLNQINPKEVAIVIDTSYSMSTNSDIAEVKEAAINILNNIASEDATTKVSLIVDGAIKNQKLIATDGNVKTLTNNINAITFASSIDMNTSLNLANSTDVFTATGTDKYVIAITDATDSMDVLDTTTGVTTNTLETLATNDIKIYSILTGITSTSFGTPDNPKPMGVLKNDGTPGPDGTVYMLDSFIGSNQTGSQDIVNNINKTVHNVSVTNTFDLSILGRYGNFTLEIVNSETDGSAVLNSDNTLTWNIDKIIGSEKAVVTYKLKLNRSATIGTNSLYNDIKVIDKTEVQYIPYNNTNIQVISESGSSAPSPTIQIADAYELRIQAVGKDTNIEIPGVTFDVIGYLNNNPNQIVVNKSYTDSDMKTDSNGYVYINTVKPLGEIYYTIIPHTDGLKGFSSNQTTTYVSIQNEYTSATGGNLVINPNNALYTTDDTNGSRYAEIKAEIELQTFKLKLDVSDQSDPFAKLSNITFRLIQPDYNNKASMPYLEGTTDSNGQIEFDVPVMTQAGEYIYTLRQETEKDGYENCVQATNIKITFDKNGNIVKDPEPIATSYITGQKLADDNVLLSIKEKCKASKFSMDISLNDIDDGTAIDGALYKIKVERITNSGSSNDSTSFTKQTENGGKIFLSAIGSPENQVTRVIIAEINPNASYIAANSSNLLDGYPVVKEIYFTKANGIIDKNSIYPAGAAQRNVNNDNELLVNLTSKKKSELNVFRVHLTQSDDSNINLIGIPVEIENSQSSNGVKYPNKTIASDAKGNIEYVLDDPSTIIDGKYEFKVKVPDTSIPSGYYGTNNEIGTVEITVQNGKVTATNAVNYSGNSRLIFMGQDTLYEDDGTTISNIAYVDYGLVVDDSQMAYFQIKLVDSTDYNLGIQNGKYEVIMSRNGIDILKAGGKYTDNNGYTGKISIPGLDTEHVTIQISQVYDENKQTGYRVDTNTYTFDVWRDSNGAIAISGLTTNGTMPNGVKVDFKSGDNSTVLFQDVNEIINPGDILIDLTVVAYEYVTKLPDQNYDMCIWSDEALIYDATKNSYKSFDINNAYSPFNTGVNAGNNAPGQIDIRLKPTQLPTGKGLHNGQTAEVTICVAQHDTNGIVPGSEVEIKMSFIYSETLGTYEFNAISHMSNWSIRKSYQRVSGTNTSQGYVENVLLELWTNYGETSNLAMDFTKVDTKGNELPGAKYNIKIAQPTGKYIEWPIEVINGNNTVEIPNAYVKEGSIITVTEYEEPIGYELDKNPEVFTVNIDATGIVTLNPQGTNNNIKYTGNSIITNSNGDIQTIANIELTDLEKNNVKFGIHSVDASDTTIGTEGNSYKIDTNTMQSTVSGKTDLDGKVSTYIGSEKKNEYLSYTISQNLLDGTSVAQYYKRLAQDITVNIYFDANGNIDSDPTSPTYFGNLCTNGIPSLGISGDANYGTTWYVEKVNDLNKIDIVIMQEREDPLNVNFKTVDAFTGNVLNNSTYPDISSYKITPTTVLPGEGVTSAQVGFVDPGQTVTYTLEATIKDNYVGIQKQQFTVTYDTDGNVTSAGAVSGSNNIIVNPSATDSKGIDIEVSIEPAVPFAIYNTDYYTGNNLQNATFEIIRESDSYSNEKTTNAKGNSVIYCGDFKNDTSGQVVYLVKQKTAAITYATVEEFKIFVEFDSNRNITNAGVYGSTDSTNKFINVHKHATCVSTDIGYNGNDKGIVDIEVKNYPAFNIDFESVDVSNDTIKLEGTKFNIKSNIQKYPISSTTEMIEIETTGTDVNGKETAYVDRTLFGGTATYEITNTFVMNGYQRIIVPIKIEVDFDSNGYINLTNAQPVRVIEGSEYVDVSLYNPATTNAENFGIKMKVKNAQDIALNINKVDEMGNKLSNVKFHIEGVVKGTTDKIYEEDITTINGLGAFKVKGAEFNKTIVYTIKETQNTAGYKYIDSELTLEVTYDNKGNINKDLSGNYEVTLTPVVSWANVSSIQDHEINLDVTNQQIDELGINLNTIDKYDSQKLADNAKIKAYLVTDTVTYNEDVDHTTILTTGKDTDGDGIVDSSHGNDYQTLGKVTGMTNATLILKEEFEDNGTQVIGTPNSYYNINDAKSYENIYMNWSYWGAKAARIDLEFDAEGKITKYTLQSDSIGTTAIGKLLDDQYIKLSSDNTNPYLLNINLYYYPMFEMTINATSDLSYERATDINDNDLIGTYTIRSWKYNDICTITQKLKTRKDNGLINEGYIGTSSLRGDRGTKGKTKQQSKTLNNNTGNYEANNFGVWVGDNDYTRTFYIYEPNDFSSGKSGTEKSEPQNAYEGYEQLQYQQHGQKDGTLFYTTYNNHLIGTVSVEYNNLGEIVSYNVKNQVDRANNWKSFITVKIADNKHGVVVGIEYKRTTTIEAIAVDNITGTEIKNLTLKSDTGLYRSQYQNLYERTIDFANLNKSDNSLTQTNKWTYWSGNDANGSRRVVLGAKYNTTELKSVYDEIGDIVLDIHYDKYGYIDKDTTKVISTDANGNPNAEITDVYKDKLNLKIIANRNFNVQIDKKDSLDNSKDLSEARFSITTNKVDVSVDGTGYNSTTSTYATQDHKDNIKPSINTKVGLIHNEKGNSTVRYTVSETTVPEGYIPIQDFWMDVTFDDDGTINKIVLEDGTILYDIFGIHKSSNIPITIVSVGKKYTELKEGGAIDLRFELTNEPKFETNITLKDQFYKEEVIEGVTFDINDITHGVQAAGTTVTDSDGKIETYTGKVYTDETVTYSIKEITNSVYTAPNTQKEYYAKDIPEIILEVEYDSNGYITSWNILQGQDNQAIINLDNDKRGFNIVIYNKPYDVTLGIEKYDQLTNAKLENTEFTVTKQEVSSATTTNLFKENTNNNGNINQQIDTFNNNGVEKEVIYTISETKQLPAYRAIEDVVIRVKYASDGSISYYNVDSNPSEVKIGFAKDQFLALSNGDKVHIKLEIPNDDTYDVIVRNEDANISGSGIEKTVYNIAINGIDLSAPEYPEINRTTDINGFVKIPNRTENGNISIKVSEKEIGTGYRKNLLNSADLRFIKGVSTYSLALDTSSLPSGYRIMSGPTPNYDTKYKDGYVYEIELDSSTGTAVKIGVYETTGKITYTFYNESKSILNITKIDTKTKDLLDGAEFTVTSQEMDNYGNTIGTVNTLATGLTTGAVENGKAELDLGTRPANKKIKYTFIETTAPSGYVSIGETSIIVSYDANGKMEIIKEPSSNRIAADGSWYDVNVKIRNGDLNTYSVKIVSVDSRYGSASNGTSTTRINGSKFDITIKDNNGNIIAQENDKVTESNINNFGNTEEGVIEVSGLEAEGTITIDLAQKQPCAEGYTIGKNQTSGQVTVDNTFVQNTTSTLPEPKLDNVVSGGFVTSCTDDELVIYVYNDPQVIFNLNKQDIDTKQPLSGVTFNVTAQIDGLGKVATVDKDLDLTTNIIDGVTSPATDNEGNVQINLGAPEYGKTVIYTIHENKVPDYDQLSDITLRVVYSSDGTISNWEIDDETYIDMKNRIIVRNGVYDWKDYTEEELDKLKTDEYTKIKKIINSRQFNAVIKNKESTKVIPYSIVLEVQDELGNPIPDIDIDLDLTETIGGETKYQTVKTDNKGQAIYSASGSDRIQLDINVASTVQYEFMSGTGSVWMKADDGTLNRLSDTGSAQSQNGGYDANGNPIIYIIVNATTAVEKYGITLMKMDSATNSTITNNPATFTVTQVENVASSLYYIKTDSTIDNKDPSVLIYNSLVDAINYTETEYINNGNILKVFDENNIEQYEPLMSTYYEIADENDNLLGIQYQNYVDAINYVETERVNNGTILKVFDDTANEIYINSINAVIENQVITNEKTSVASGVLSVSQINKPTVDGTYTYRIYEDNAPTGYKGLNGYIEVYVTYTTDASTNEMKITNVVSSDTSKVYVAKYTNNGFALCINNDETVPDDQYMMNIFKVDGTNGDKLDGALFKVSLPDSNSTSVYSESGENTANQGQLDYCYVEQDKNYETRLKQMKKPEVIDVKNAGGKLTHTYTFQEAVAPDGYALDKTIITLSIDFVVDIDTNGNEYVRIDNAISSDTSRFIINKIDVDHINADIVNMPQNSVVTTYTVHYDANTTDTVTVPADQLKTAGMPLTLDANVPVRSGFTFKEWNTAADGTGTAFSPAGTYALDADVTLYAIWEVAQYTVHYESNAPIDANTGVAIGLVTDMPADQTKTHGIDITLDDDNLTPTIPNVANYYEFAGWNTLAGGTGTHYDAGDIYNIDTDLTLYAEWNYIIHYNANIPVDTNGLPMSTANNIPADQHEKVNSQIDAIIDDLNIYTNAPTMDGYKFKEWNTAADGTGDTYNPNDTYTSRKGIDLYAIWQYEITYDENKPLDTNGLPINTSISNMPIANPQVVDVNNTAIVDNTTDNPVVPTMQPDDYIFKEWNTAKDGSGDSYKPDDVYSGNISVTLYAIWVEQGLYLKTLNYDYKITDVTFTTAKRYTVNTTNENEYNNGDKYILGIIPEINVATSLKNTETEGTTIDKFLTEIDTNATTIKFYKKDGITEITDRTSLISTGDILKASKGTKSIELILIVRGDVWGKSVNARYKDEDGILRSADQTKISNYLTDDTILPDLIDRLAADTNLDGRINTKDAGDIVQGILQCNKSELNR